MAKNLTGKQIARDYMIAAVGACAVAALLWNTYGPGQVTNAVLPATEQGKTTIKENTGYGVTSKYDEAVRNTANQIQQKKQASYDPK